MNEGKIVVKRSDKPLKDLKELIRNFSKIKVLVVGDVMLDRYQWGTVSRISPEAPVPIVNLEKTSLTAGGAANVAANVAGLGAKPILIGITGRDAEAKIFPETLQNLKIDDFRLFAQKDRPTTIKTRIIAHNHHVVRIDQETTNPISQKAAFEILGQIEKDLDGADILIISDYAKGFLTPEFLTRLITTARAKGKSIIVDPKGKDYSKFKGATVLTPNQKEAADACNLENHTEDLVEKAGKILLGELGLEALLITQGEKGMTLFQKNRKPSHLKATARTVYDVTGAGDTVIACLAAGLGIGLSFLEAADFANFAAGLVVEQVGTTAIDKDILLKSVK